MKFDPRQFTLIQPGFYQFDWEKSKDEKVAIFVHAVSDADLGKAVGWIDEFLEKETQLRKTASQRIYPSDAYWLEDECELTSAEELLAVLQWTILDVGELEDGMFQFRLVYTGPDDFQTIRAKQVMMVAGVNFSSDGDWDVWFESYCED
ncbi:MAG: hypothetical protein K9N47_09985 [Prosthecobacter sp.]|uniref:hypothetical protein n=1 Tax=Prosthecobacter sp. TaxID=1965333 RepID=UPI0025E385BD|nr:hypothetical protein [Prosthecobacter sp.]MCF7786443.1 hypothetical protein [Prosthecobacter sp.]